MTQPCQLPAAPRVLREYALLADGERGALIGPDGTVSWLCAPRWDSPAVFSGLLGGPGRYTVTPAAPWHVWGGYYDNGSLIWHSRWAGDSVIECREALAMPADPHRVVMLRRIEAVDGPARVRVTLDVRAEYGQCPMTGLYREGECWTGRSGQVRFRWLGCGQARPGDDGLTATIDLAAGESRDLVLELSDRPLPGQEAPGQEAPGPASPGRRMSARGRRAAPPGPDRAWADTRRAWDAVVPDCGDLIAVADARHAYAVLRGLTSASGAMVAAATTSLPERLEAGRNYDYRYAWIRDQCYSGLAIAAHGPHPLLEGTVRFVTGRVLGDGPGLMPAYTVAGEPIPDQGPLPLRGFPGGTAREGNTVRRQFQLDGLGEVLTLLAAAARHGMLDGESWRAAVTAADAIAARWREPDAGIWELDDQMWTHSRLACVSGLRSMAAAASGPPGGPGQRAADRWDSLAEAILGGLGGSVHRTGRWQRSPDDQRVDAALLLPVIRGGLPPRDPRARATAAAVCRELASDGYVYRFRHDDRPLHEAEGAFLLCGFWMALLEHDGGDPVAAAHWFERNRAACGPAGLYTEEYDVRQRQLRGNLPQAFVHAGMLECAARLSRDVSLGRAGG
jgi:hypothetical protein